MIYTVTGVPDERRSETRCFGYFPSFYEAKDALRENQADLYEAGAYKYIVIEEFDSGLHAKSGIEIWYMYFELKGRFEFCDKPSLYQGITSFAMG